VQTRRSQNIFELRKHRRSKAGEAKMISLQIKRPLFVRPYLSNNETTSDIVCKEVDAERWFSPQKDPFARKTQNIHSARCPKTFLWNGLLEFVGILSALLSFWRGCRKAWYGEKEKEKEKEWRKKSVTKSFLFPSFFFPFHYFTERKKVGVVNRRSGFSFVDS